ncbi:MAG: GHKL domain-containing protein [Synergistaceae bacterium]|nr:GHKL domain-containing protein [Synergistaceae bacterium]
MTINYILNPTMIIPGTLFALAPAVASVRHSSSDSSLVRGMFALSPGRKAFCIFNSVMLCEFCSMYTKFIVAPYELASLVNGRSSLFPDMVILGMSAVIGAVFFRTLTLKLPVLMNEERVSGVWHYMFLAPLVMSAVVHWMTPVSPLVVMTGRVRPISLALVTFVMLTAYMFYHMFWWTTTRLTENARLQQENTFLQMEAKRYNELRRYMNHTQAMRHDFRQHVLVIHQLAEAGQLYELREYVSGLAESTSKSYVNYCANPAVDAVASHYDHAARHQDTVITWSLELPAALPVSESDYCGLFGNLVENALKAVRNLPAEQRRIKVLSSMLSKFMIGISIDNPYSGKITFGKNGLPLSGKQGHGIGLISVMNTVNRYGGSMSITAEGNIFSADIILYSNS